MSPGWRRRPTPSRDWSRRRPAGDGIAEARFLAVAAYVSTAWAIGVPSAISVVALALLLGALGAGERTRLAAAAAYGLGTLAFPYSTLLYGHQVAAAFTLCAFALLVHARHVVTAPGRSSWRAPGRCWAAPSWSSIPRPSPRRRSPPTPPRSCGRSTVWAGWPPAPHCPAPLSRSTTPSSSAARSRCPTSSRPRRTAPGASSWGSACRTRPCSGTILLSPYRGLFFSSPWPRLSLPARSARCACAPARCAPEAITCIAIALLHLWLNASLADWRGGRAMGARYPRPLPPLRRHPRGRPRPAEHEHEHGRHTRAPPCRLDPRRRHRALAPPSSCSPAPRSCRRCRSGSPTRSADTSSRASRRASSPSARRASTASAARRALARSTRAPSSTRGTSASVSGSTDSPRSRRSSRSGSHARPGSGGRCGGARTSSTKMSACKSERPRGRAHCTGCSSAGAKPAGELHGGSPTRARRAPQAPPV